MKKKLVTSLVVGLCMLCMVGMAEADLFQGNSSGTFVNPNTGTNTGVGTSHFTTGTGTPTWIDFVGSSFDVNADTTFVFGELTYFNGANSTGSTASTVDLDVSSNLTSPLNISKDFFYNLTFNMTLNSGTAEQNADYLYLPTAQPASNFLFGGIDYTLAFTGFGILDSNGFVTTIDQFHIFEGTSASTQLMGQFTEYTPASAPVPEPATLLLLGTGLACLIGTRFRKKKK